MKPWTSTLLKVGFVLVATTLAWFSVPAAIIAIAATMLAALHGKANSIIELSFGPLTAKLEREVTEAERLIAKLRHFTAVVAQAAVAASAHTGRFATEDDWQFAQLKRLEAALAELSVGPEVISHVRSELVRPALRDLGHCATGGNTVPMQLGQEAQADWKAARREGRFENPDSVQQWLEKWNLLTPERRQLIDDMRWIQEHCDIRDREQFLRSRKPIDW